MSEDAPAPQWSTLKRRRPGADVGRPGEAPSSVASAAALGDNGAPAPAPAPAPDARASLESRLEASLEGVPFLSPASPLQKALPFAAATAAAAFLIASGVMSYRYNMRRAAAQAKKAADAAARAASEAAAGGGGARAPPTATPDAPSGMPTSTLAMKALAYGTLLCVGAFGVAGAGVALYLDVSSAQEFADAMRARLPRARDTLQSALAPSLARVGRAAHGAIHAVLPAQEAPADDGLHLDDLPPADAAALGALTSALASLLEEGEGGEGGASAAPPRAQAQAQAQVGGDAHPPLAPPPPAQLR